MKVLIYTIKRNSNGYYENMGVNPENNKLVLVDDKIHEYYGDIIELENVQELPARINRERLLRAAQYMLPLKRTFEYIIKNDEKETLDLNRVKNATGKKVYQATVAWESGELELIEFFEMLEELKIKLAERFGDMRD